MLIRIPENESDKIKEFIKICSSHNADFEWVPQPHPKTEIQATVNMSCVPDQEAFRKALTDNEIIKGE